ncbi:MAG: TIGR03619 family F420-dependent LLM class oxidoreductase [Candidatus Binataceae bacterium]
MKLGIALPQMGDETGPESIAKFAERAESLGYDSLWVNDRLMWPLNPREPYSDTPDGRLPEVYQRIFDPIETLTFVTPLTKRVQLGTSIIVGPYQGPVLLARRLATLDVLSNGRLICGVGVGWSSDEYDACGIALRKRDTRMAELLQAMVAVWQNDTVEFHGKFYNIAPSKIGPKPLQKPYPPIYQSAFGERSMRRLSQYCNGWNPPNPESWESFDRQFADLQRYAREAGRDPRALGVILRAHVDMTDEPRAAAGKLFSGTFDQIKLDTRDAREHGVEHMFIELGFTPGMTLARMFAQMEQLRALQ